VTLGEITHQLELSRSDQWTPVVIFKETPENAPPAIDAWFFDDTVGCEMVY